MTIQSIAESNSGSNAAPRIAKLMQARAVNENMSIEANTAR